MKARTRSRTSRTWGVVPSSCMSASIENASGLRRSYAALIHRRSSRAAWWARMACHRPPLTISSPFGPLDTVPVWVPNAANAVRHRRTQAARKEACCSMKRDTLLGELSAELLGTFTLIIFGVGVVAQTVLTPFTAGAQSFHWAWGFGVVMGVYVAGGIAGAHINPARDFGPRLASWITGWSHAWNDQRGNFYAWVPILGPFIGGVLGGIAYDLFISRFLPVGRRRIGRAAPARTPCRCRAGAAQRSLRARGGW